MNTVNDIKILDDIKVYGEIGDNSIVKNVYIYFKLNVSSIFTYINESEYVDIE